LTDSLTETRYPDLGSCGNQSSRSRISLTSSMREDVTHIPRR
jgi:hypothetical protein